MMTLGDPILLTPPGAVFARNCSAVGALALLSWECIITVRQEHWYIWRNPSKVIKSLYLFSRYFALSSLLFGFFFMIHVCSDDLARPETCRVWFGFLVFGTQLLLMCIEILLMLRVYALYERRRLVGGCLTAVFCGCNAAEGVFGMRSLLASSFDSNCLATTTPQDVALYAAFLLFTQLVIFGFTAFKRRSAITRGWLRAPIIQVTARDGILMFVGVAGLVIASVPYAMFVEAVAHYIYPWISAFLSIGACRLIINMQRLQRRSLSPATSTSPPDSTVEFTTDIEIETGIPQSFIA
ncbi:hypothetical protein BDN72DRAFT_960863 [Pluteus cervinus]|uniref:Uncharacterized protein n=1 Tax=Pluteus cervinus TaxID=181527 RepID=A0ACD3AQP0_9AGAR|nr:hypothetical protein BDN72DRAFT_960863 [Pluteus cervinus]